MGGLIMNMQPQRAERKPQILSKGYKVSDTSIAYAFIVALPPCTRIAQHHSLIHETQYRRRR